jgi:hypothetical protein
VGPEDVQGLQGLQGPKGTQGLPGPPGPSPGTTPLDPSCSRVGSAAQRSVTSGGSASGEGSFSFTLTDIEIDYSAHIDEVICEFHQHNVTHIAILNELRRLADNSDVMKVHQGTMAEMLTKIAGHHERIDSNTDRIRVVAEHLRVLADTTGITTRSPYDYLYTYSVLRSLEIENISVATAINGHNSLPPQTLASPSPAQTPQSASPLRWEGTWDENHPYKTDDIIFHGDKPWVAIRPNVGALPPCNPDGNKIWKPLTEAIVVKAEKPKEVWKGTWNKNLNYPAGSIVMYKPGLENDSVDTLADLAYSAVQGKIYKASENIGAYIQTRVLPSDGSQSDGHTCWTEISYCAEPDECENIPLLNVTIKSTIGDITCTENKLALLDNDAVITVEPKNNCFDLDDFVKLYHRTYISESYKERAQALLEYFITNNKYTISNPYDLDDFVDEYRNENTPEVYKNIAKLILPYYTSNQAYTTDKNYDIDDFVQEFKESYAPAIYKARTLAILPYFTSNNEFFITKCYNMDDFVTEFKGSKDPTLYKQKAESLLPLFKSNNAFTVAIESDSVAINWKAIVINEEPPPPFRPTVPIDTIKVTANKSRIKEGNSVTFTIETTLPNGTELYWKNIGTTDTFDLAFSDNEEIFNSLTTPASPSVYQSKNSVYVDLLNQVGVWESDVNRSTFERSYAVDFPVTGSYMISGACDNKGYLYIDDVEMAFFPSLQNTINKTIQVTAGIRRLRIVGHNDNGPGSFGLIIKGGVASNSGSFIVQNGVGTVTLFTRNDGVSEQEETIILEIKKDSITGTTLTTSQAVSVIDAIPTWSIIPNTTSVNEVTFKKLQVQSSNFYIENNTVLSFIKIDDQISILPGGRGTTMAVFEPETLTLTFKRTFDTWGNYSEDDALVAALNAVSDGKLLVLISCDALRINEAMRQALNTHFGGQSDFVLLGQDEGNRGSHIFVGYRGGPLLHEMFSTNRVQPIVFSIDLPIENTIEYSVVTTNVPNGYTAYYNSNNPDDIIPSSGSFVIQNGAGNINLKVKADNKREETESLVVNVTTDTGSILATSVPVFINDTVPPPSPSFTITPTSSTMAEWSEAGYQPVLELNIRTTNVDNGTLLYYTCDPPERNDDFSFAFPGSGFVEIQNNSGIIKLGAISDKFTEGPETFRIELRTGSRTGPIVATSSLITISDTSTGTGDTQGFCFWPSSSPNPVMVQELSLSTPQNVAYNPTFGPTQGVPGEYRTNTTTPVIGNITGGPPNAVVTVNKYSDANGMFNKDYVAGTNISYTITLSNTGTFTDEPRIFPVAGNVFYTFTFRGTPITRTRYGLFRNPDRADLSYWTNKIINENLDPTSREFYTSFFRYYDSLGATRHVTNDKTFDPTSASGCGFYDDPPTGIQTVARYGLYRWPDRNSLKSMVNLSLSNNYQINSLAFNNQFFTFCDDTQITRHLNDTKTFDDTHAVNAPEFRDQPLNWAGPTRYGLWQYPDRASLRVSVNYAIEQDLSPTSITYRTIFFTYMTSLGRTRHLTQDKAFDGSNTGGGFYDAPANWPGADRWALYRYPDHENLAYWTTLSLDRQLAPYSIEFNTAFFNGLSLVGEKRHLTDNKIFDPTTNGCGFRANPTDWNQGGSGNIEGLDCTKKFKIFNTNKVNTFRIVNENCTPVYTTKGLAANLTFYAEKKKPNPNLTEVEFKGCWEDCTIYKTHEMVLHNQVTWVATRDNTGNEPNSKSRYWREILTEQAAFIDNPPLWKGAWVNSTTYPQNSIVSHDNKSYIAKNYVDITTTPLPPPQAPKDWKIVDDPSIYCAVPEKEKPDVPKSKSTKDVKFVGPYVSTYPITTYDIVIHLDPEPDPEPEVLFVSDIPEFFKPIIETILNPTDENEPVAYVEDEVYDPGTVVYFTPIFESLPVPPQESLQQINVPRITVPPELYIALKPNGPGTPPRKDPNTWAKILPKLGPPRTLYPKNTVVPIGKRLFVSLEPMTEVPKFDPNTGTNLIPAVVEIPNGKTGRPGWAILEDGGLVGVPIQSSYFRPVKFTYRREWDWRTQYYTNEVVVFCGVLYKALEDSLGAVPPYNLGNLLETSTKWVELSLLDLE